MGDSKTNQRRVGRVQPKPPLPVSKPRILLFGRTGSGKSTVANMLASGHLLPPLLFATSSGVRGGTLDIQREDCADMVIVDTVGLGESEHGSVSNADAQRILYDFFKHVEEGFHFLAFVRKWGRNDFLDEQLWKFFRQAFRGAEKNFLLILTHLDKPEELEVPATKELLLKMYGPACQRCISVDFPPDSGTNALEAMRRVNDRRRARSLARLKEKLGEFRRPAKAPDVCVQLRLGRVLLLGRRPTAKGMLANLLVKGNFLHCPVDNLPFPISSPQSSTATTSQSSIKEDMGRRWEVVDMHAFDSYMDDKRAVQGIHTKLAPAMAESIVSTLLQDPGFSHVVFVHESGYGQEKDELIDRMYWQIVKALLSGAMRKDRLVLVIARNSQESLEGAAISEHGRFRNCPNLVHLDIPFFTGGEQLKSSLQTDECARRLDSARRVLEQVLQKEVDTQSTFFKLQMPTHEHKQHLIAHISEAYLTPVVKAMNKRGNKRRIIFTVSKPALSKLLSAYREILNKDESVISDDMWQEQAISEEEEEDDEGTAVAAIAIPKDSNFCESRQLVVGEYLNFEYLSLKFRGNGSVKRIEVTIESRIDYGAPEDHWRKLWTGFELAVMAPDCTQIGKRVEVYLYLQCVDEWRSFSKSITEPAFLATIKDQHVIVLYLRSGELSTYTCCASITLVT